MLVDAQTAPRYDADQGFTFVGGARALHNSFEQALPGVGKHAFG
jgi:hypothetical protein